MATQQPYFYSVHCPSTADGFYPQCKCRDGLEYDETFNTCGNTRKLATRACPANAKAAPTYPQCDCSGVGRNYAYNKELNVCFPTCPPNASG